MTTSVLHALATGLPTSPQIMALFPNKLWRVKTALWFRKAIMKLWPKNNLYDGAPEVWADFGSFGRKHVDINFNEQ